MAAAAVMAPGMMGMGMMGHMAPGHMMYAPHRGMMASPPRRHASPPPQQAYAPAPAPAMAPRRAQRQISMPPLALGSVVRITTSLAGLRLKGVLLAVDRVSTDLTIQTARFGKPLRVEAWNIRHVETVRAPAPAPAPRRAATAPATLSPVDELALRARSPPRAGRPRAPSSTRAGSPSTLNGAAVSFVPSSPPSHAGVPMHTAAPAPPPGFARHAHARARAHVPAHAALQHSYMAAPVARVPLSVAAPPAMPVLAAAAPIARSPSPAGSVASAASGGSDGSASSGKSGKSGKWTAPCKYFNTSKGCTRGTSCRYAHVRMAPEELAAMLAEEELNSAAAVPSSAAARAPSPRRSSSGKSRKTRRGRKRSGRM